MASKEEFKKQIEKKKAQSKISKARYVKDDLAVRKLELESNLNDVNESLAAQDSVISGEEAKLADL